MANVLLLTSYKYRGNVYFRTSEEGQVILQFKNYYDTDGNRLTIIFSMENDSFVDVSVLDNNARPRSDISIPQDEIDMVVKIMKQIRDNISWCPVTEIEDGLELNERDILIPIVKKGIEEEQIVLSVEGDDSYDSVKATIGDYWFYAFDQEEKAFSEMTEDEVVTNIACGLLDLKNEVNEIEYAYYIAVLTE